MLTAASTEESTVRSATLLRTDRITPPQSAEEVRHLLFRAADLSFRGRVGQCIRVLAPGQFGSKHHTRLYSIADPDPSRPESTEFTLCVRRCFYIDEFNGEQYKGVASNYLCDLRPGATIEFTGPIGYPFPIPDNTSAGLIMIGMGTGIAPFRGLIRRIYEQSGGWKGKVRLFYGARTGLEMLYMNEENRDLALYFDQKTFKAFQAVSPRPHFGAPVALDKALEANAAEVWAMMGESDTHVYVAGTHGMLASVERALAGIAGSEAAWQETKAGLASSGRWSEILY